jgi:threonine/homoserine/homoserine lactone efflux protein
VIATAVHSAIVLLASRLQSFATSERRRKPVRRALALLLAGNSIWLAYSTAR